MAFIKKKICLLGSFAVGKTSLVERFVYNRFDEKYLTTVGVKISQKIMPPIQDRKSGQMIQHNFLIWDIAGFEKFDHVAKNYLRGAAGALGVADLTRPDTIGQLKDFCDQFQAVSPEAFCIIIGNKLDIFDNNPMTLSHLEKITAHYETEYRLTSAKTGEHIDDAFFMLSKKIQGLA